MLLIINCVLSCVFYFFYSCVLVFFVVFYYFFFFKQKTAYEMRISDWSSDVCSSDLPDDIEHRLQRSQPVSRFDIAHQSAQRSGNIARHVGEALDHIVVRRPHLRPAIAHRVGGLASLFGDAGAIRSDLRDIVAQLLCGRGADRKSAVWGTRVSD